MSGWVITVYHAIGFCQRMGSSFWSDVCKAAVTQSPLRKTTTSNALCGAIVALYALAFLASSYRVRQFMSIQPQNKTKVWTRFRVFNSLLMCASVFGSVAWASNVQNTQLQFQAGSLNTANTLNGTFRPTPPDALFQIKRLAAESASWSASFFVFSALEFAAVSISQMLILDRLLSFLLKSTSLLSEQRRYTNVWQGALALVAAANAVGVCASLAAAASQAQASVSFLTAASAYARGDIAAAEEQNNSAEAFVLRAAETSSIQVLRPRPFTPLTSCSCKRLRPPKLAPSLSSRARYPTFSIFCAQRITEALVGVTMLVFFALFGIASVKMLRHVVELTSKKNLMTNVSFC
jgi:hypothetical protein